MGKSQKKRAVRRHNPVRVPDAHLPKGLDAAAASSTKRDAVLPIIQKLEGIDPGERAWACSAVSNLIQNDPSTRRLLQGKNVVGALINRLSDSVEEVVIEAAGALRNLCIDGGYDICAEMYNKNILAPLTQCLPKISTALEQFISSPKSAPESAKDLVFGFTENVITILWCLSETSNKALNAVNKIQMVPFLQAILDHRGQLAPRTVNVAAQCLYVLTDDNFPVINEVRSSASCISTLMQIATSNEDQQTHAESQFQQSRALSLKISAAGILKNISPIPPPSNASSVDINTEIVLPLLTPVIQNVALPDISARVFNLISRQSEEPVIDKPSLKHTPKSDHKSDIQLELEQIEETLRGIQLSLEILTDVCATLPDPSSSAEGEIVDDAADDDDGDVSVKSGDDDDNVDMNLDESTTNGNAELSSKVTSTALPALTESLLKLCLPTELSFPPLSTSTAAPSPYPPITSALGAIHIRALECLNNLFLSLAVTLSTSRNTPNANTAASVAADIASGNRVWESLWSALSKVGTEGVIGVRGQEARNQMWEAAVGILWSVSDIWKGHIVPQVWQIQVLVQLYGSVPDEHFKVKCIGTLECMAQHPNSFEVNAMVSTFLLSLLPASSSTAHSTECVLQATSALIDIYSDEDSPYDTNFRSGPHLGLLSDSIEGLRKLVRGIDRKKDGGRELRRRGDEILENLRGFVKYRKDLHL